MFDFCFCWSHVVLKKGRMKGLAFALDPDGYSIEIVKRSEKSKCFGKGYTLNQCMLRVKDAKKSLDFFVDKLGMQLVKERHFDESKGDFSLYFLQDSILGKEEGDVDKTDTNSFRHPVVLLSTYYFFKLTSILSLNLHTTTEQKRMNTSNIMTETAKISKDLDILVS